MWSYEDDVHAGSLLSKAPSLREEGFLLNSLNYSDSSSEEERGLEFDNLFHSVPCSMSLEGGHGCDLVSRSRFCRRSRKNGPSELIKKLGRQLIRGGLMQTITRGCETRRLELGR